MYGNDYVYAAQTINSFIEEAWKKFSHKDYVNNENMVVRIFPSISIKATFMDDIYKGKLDDGVQPGFKINFILDESFMIGEEDHVNIIHNLIRHYDSDNGCDFHDLMDYGLKWWHTVYTHEDDLIIVWR